MTNQHSKASKDTSKQLGEYWNIKKLRAWKDNPRDIKEKDFTRLKKQIKDLGQYKPLLITPDGEVLGGNMRLRAYGELGIKELWVSIVHPKDKNEKLAYALSDNDRAGFYVEELLLELLPDYDLEWQDYAIDLSAPSDLLKFLDSDLDEKYTKAIKAPTYEPSDVKPNLKELVNTEKTDELVQQIEKADIPDDIKSFLKMGAQRHLVFNYSKVADFYAHSDKDTKELFEKSALVIIDFKKAIEGGFVRLTEYLLDIQDENE